MMEAGKDYGVRVMVAYQHRQIGQVFFPPGVLREALIKRGLVEAVQPPAQESAFKETLAELLPRRKRERLDVRRECIEK